MSGILAELLSATSSLQTAGMMASTTLRTRADEIDRTHRSVQGQIIGAIWSGESAGDVKTDVALALDGAHNATLEETLSTLEAKLLAHEGEFIAVRALGMDTHNYKRCAFSVIRKGSLRFERRPPSRWSNDGCSVRHEGSMVLPTSKTYVLNEWSNVILESPWIPVLYHQPIQGQKDSAWLNQKIQRDVHVGDQEVWAYLTSARPETRLTPCPMIAAEICEKLGRPLGTVPHWKEQTRPFKEEVEGDLPKLRRIVKAAKGLKRQVGEIGPVSRLSSALHLLGLLAHEDGRVQELEHFLEQWKMAE